VGVRRGGGTVIAFTPAPPVPLAERLPKLSITKIIDFERCPIYGYRKHVDGESTPSTPAKAFGIELHELGEHYLREGRMPHEGKAGALLRSGLHLLPVIGTVQVEQWIGLPAIGRCEVAPDGVPLTGKVDYFAPPGPTSAAAWSHYTGDLETRTALAALGLTAPRDAPHVIYVGDHKTTSDLAAYALTPAQIAVDWQLATYAVAIVGAAAAGRPATPPRAAVLENAV
jgi:hypothetical protein